MADAVGHVNYALDVLEGGADEAGAILDRMATIVTKVRALEPKVEALRAAGGAGAAP
ncbi:MAG: hypothetical protein AAF184_09765 [Pseudomonadota bacterium]